MRTRSLPAVIVIPLLLTAVFGAAYGSEFRRFEAEIEAGLDWQSRNDVRIPNTGGGTRFSLVDLAGRGPWLSARLYLTCNISPKHGIRLLLAPLSYTEEGVFRTQVDFEGESFDPGVSTEATYKFNSWRATYRYRFYRNDRWTLHIGFTAKVRDAKIELAQQGRTASKTDLGFVPLLHLAADYVFAQRWHLTLDLDALAGGPGRAEDLSLKIGCNLNDRWRISAGYRTLEGGADVEEVYNFAWLNYAVASASCSF